MSVKCPYCSSTNINRSQTGTSVVSCIGAVGGIASAVHAAMSTAPKHSPHVFTVATVANLILAGLAGGLSGSALGTQLGQELDNKLFPDFQCNSCHHRFSPVIALT